MNDSSSNQDTGNSGVPPVITGAPISKPPPLPGDASSASLFLPRSAEVTLKEILSRIEARQRRLRLWLKLAACWAAAALLGGCLLVIQRENGWTSTATLPSVAFVAVIAALVVLLRSRRGSADPRQLASQIEARHPELDGLLLTAAQQHADGGGELNFLQERLIREAMAHSRKQDWAAIVPRSHLALAQLANVAALVILVLVLGQFRGTGGHHLFTKTPNSEISVTPGDATIERGSSLVILARFGQALPPNVDLVIASAQGKDNRIPLVKSLADPVFGGSLSEVASNLTYHVEYGGRRTRDFKVTVFDYPRLERADADLVFPDYTGQKAQHIDNTRRVTAVEGSQVSFALQFNKPVASARLVPKDKERASVALTLETNQPGALLKQFPLADSQTYDLQLVDSEGRTNKMPAQFVFAVLTNRTPELRLASPRGDMRPSPLEEISFEGTVWDDFGVQAYGLGYQLAGEEPKFIELGGKVASKEKRSFQHLLSLEKLGVQSDQLISWFVWADDIGPDGQVRRTPGDLFFGEVRPFDEVFREGQGMEGQQDQQQNQMGGGQMGGQAGRLAELQKQIISATWRLQRENSAKKPASSGSKEERAPAKLDQTRSPAQPVPQETYYVTARQFAGQLAPGRGTTRNASPRNPTRSRQSSNQFARELFR